MSKAKRLSEYERGKIDGLRSENKSLSQIAKIINRSKTVVHNYLKNRENYGIVKGRGRKKKLDKLTLSKIRRRVSNEIISASKVKHEFGLNVSTRTVQRYLASIPTLQLKKLKQKPKLTAQHKINRLEFAEYCLKNKIDWFQVVFSDEKKFNLDGPDGFQYYWHDIRSEPKYLSKRKFGGGSLMVWAAFGSRGKSELVVISNRMDSPDYIEVLKNHLLPCGKNIGGKNWIFQQDNARIHTSAETLNWLDSKKVDYLDWPSISPDLNPIENLWGILVRRLFHNGKQYSTVKELKSKLMEIWDDIKIEELHNLIFSMEGRLIDVIKNDGGATRY